MNSLIDFLPKEAIKIGNKFFISTNVIAGAAYSGTFLGAIEQKEFIPSLQFVELLQKKMNTMKVAKKAAWLFSCQRDILQKGVISIEKKNPSSKLYVVTTESNEVIGIAEERGAVFTPIFDCGYYLRREFTR